MADELLSDAEIEVLLGKRRSAARGTSVPLQHSIASQPGLPPRLAEPLARIHERCAREFAVELSALLRRTVRVRVVAIRETSSRESDAGREPSSGTWHFDTQPHLGQWHFGIAPDVLMPMIDCMLGGGREPAAAILRPLTEIELRLADRVVRMFLAALKSSWQMATTLPLEMAASSPADDAHAPATALVSVSFELDMAAARGEMHLGIPLPTVAILLGQRNASQLANNSVTYDAAAALQSGTVELVASLGETQIEQNELANLAIGDIIATDQVATRPIAVSHDGVVKFEARLGASQGRKALEIERTVPTPNERRGG
jgi:flagellar motor switch protein FliM